MIEGLRRMLTLKQIGLFSNSTKSDLKKDSYFTAVLPSTLTPLPTTDIQPKTRPRRVQWSTRTEPGQSSGLRPSLSRHRGNRPPLSSQYIFYRQSLHLPFYCNALSRVPSHCGHQDCTQCARGTEEPQTLRRPRTSV